MAPLNVLLVEDNRLVRWCVTCGLSRDGFHVVAPETVDEVLHLNGGQKFDILVTDWRLSGDHDGFEVLTHIRKNSPQVVSILISAQADAQLEERARTAGFSHVIEKPCPVAEIVSAVKALANSATSRNG